MFKFRLAKVQRLREHKEKICLEKVENCVSQFNQALKKKKEMKYKIVLLENDFSKILNGVISPDEIKLYRNYLTYQYKLLKLHEEVVAEKKQNLEAAKQKLIQAMKERKIIDKLHEKQYLRYIEEENKREQNLQDEMAINIKRR
jgi:flagellar FliJ protein